MGNSIKRLEYEKPKEVVDDKYHLFDEKKESEKDKDKNKIVNIKTISK